MVNVGLSWSSIVGIALALSGVGLYFLRSWRPTLARDHDIFFAAVALLCGGILFFQGWRQDPILQFGQFMLTGAAIFFAVESIRLRGIATEQARRNAPIVDEDRPVSSSYQYQDAELDYDSFEERQPVARRIRGTPDARSTEYEDDYESLPSSRSRRSSSSSSSSRRSPRSASPNRSTDLRSSRSRRSRSSRSTAAPEAPTDWDDRRYSRSQDDDPYADYSAGSDYGADAGSDRSYRPSDVDVEPPRRSRRPRQRPTDDYTGGDPDYTASQTATRSTPRRRPSSDPYGDDSEVDNSQYVDYQPLDSDSDIDSPKPYSDEDNNSNHFDD